MRNRRRILGRIRPALAAEAADGDVVVFALFLAAAIAARTTAVQAGDWPTTKPDVSVMHNVSEMIARLLDNYDMRLRPQFGGSYM